MTKKTVRIKSQIKIQSKCRRSKKRRSNIVHLDPMLETMLEQMQTPEFMNAIDALFSASPEELGKAAVRAAVKRKHKK